MTIQRTFLVTGASKGIGLAISNSLAGAGHHVVGVARGASSGFPGTLVSIDLRDDLASTEAFAELAERYSFDGVVNNVGSARLRPVGDIPLTELDEIIRGNLHPTLLATQAILPGMKAKRWGRIVNISSLVALGVRNRTAYAAAKAAVNSFTRTWALELAETGVTVNGVAPGPIGTEMFRRGTPAGSEAEQIFLDQIPMRRLGKPDEVAAAATFLLSDDAGFITGQTLYVDGGGSIGKAG